MVRSPGNSRLMQQIARGDYTVDERAVADAILTKLRERRGSGVLVPAQALERLSSPSLQDDPAPRARLA